MTSDQLRNSILQEAISGRLVPQDPNDEPVTSSAIIPEDDIPFEIPSTWAWTTMSNCAKIIGGYAFPSASIKGEKGVRVIRISDISEKGFVNKSVVRYNGSDNLEKFKVQPQDILMAMTGGTVGKSLFVQQMEEDMLLNQRVAIIRNNGQYAPYIDIVVKSPHIKSFINDKKNSTNDNISMGDINSFLVPLPPLAEQKRIVAKLEELLPIVEQYGKAQKELDLLNAALPARLRQSILQEAISGKLVPQDENETADGLVKLITDRKNALLKSGELEKRYAKELPIDDSEFEIELPKGWRLCKLGNIARISAGGTPARGVAAYWSNGKIPWLKISDITASDKYVNSASEYITEAGMNNSSAKLMKKGTLLYTIFASIGEVGILNFEATCNQAIANIDLYVPEMTNYIYYYLKNLQAYMYSISKGCAQLNINQDILKNAIIPLPPLAEQQRIVAKIEELFEQIDQIKK